MKPPYVKYSMGKGMLQLDNKFPCIILVREMLPMKAQPERAPIIISSGIELQMNVNYSAIIKVNAIVFSINKCY